ncbi:MAG: Asp23/Gls24 family envelope stress response protein [bacterium]|nr:Asp23/Gls24 family envelope stress response protein [bacterium]
MKNTKKKVTPKPVEQQQVSQKSIDAINEYGTVQISEDVVMATVRKAACAVDGVSRLAGGSFVENLTNMISSQKSSDSAIKLDINGNTLVVEVKVNVIYGEHIPEVAMRVQNTITDEVKHITGMDVQLVNVIVQEIETVVSED